MEWDKIGMNFSQDWNSRRSEGGPRIADGCNSAERFSVPQFWAIDISITLRWCSESLACQCMILRYSVHKRGFRRPSAGCVGRPGIVIFRCELST